jgi:hypothetical protein
VILSGPPPSVTMTSPTGGLTPFAPHSWESHYQPHLYLYGAPSGIVYDLVVNKSVSGEKIKS